MREMIIKIAMAMSLLVVTSFAGELDNKGISLSYGEGAENIYIVANPQCKYTRVFFNESKKKLKKYKVNIILLPLEHLPNSPAMIDYILMGETNEDKVSRFNDIVFNNSDKYKKLDSYREYMVKVEVGENLEEKYYKEKGKKSCMDAFIIKRKIIDLNINYRYSIKSDKLMKFGLKNIDYLKAGNSPTIYNNELKEVDWMKLVEDKERFRVKCFAKIK